MFAMRPHNAAQEERKTMPIIEEFPDYPTDSLPSIPADWLGVSWRHDACPSWRTLNLQIYVEWPDPEMRDIPGPRYRIHELGDDGEFVAVGLETDDWQSVLDYVNDVGIDSEAERGRA